MERGEKETSEREQRGWVVRGEENNMMEKTWGEMVCREEEMVKMEEMKVESAKKP